jgi:CARDB
MLRRLVACASLAVALVPGAAAHASSTPLSARLTACVTGPDPAGRSATFTASMPLLPGADRMWMRFDLQERTPASAVWTRLSVPKFGVWERSNPGVPGFIYTKRVDSLRAPAAYRAVVQFRWYSADRRLLRSARRVTRICHEPDPRPDLRAGALNATDGPDPGTAVYQLVVRNDGIGAAAAFDVGLVVDGVPQPSQRAGALDAGGREVVSFLAPRCRPGSVLRFTLDARGEVDEASEANDAIALPCPLA